MYCHLLIAIYYFRSVVPLEAPELPDYCSLSCHEKPHTICLRNYACEPVENCSIMPVDAQFRENMLSVHNILRNNIASGATRGQYGNTGAKNMRSLSYDMELEFLAECWASLCPGFKHDDCRQTDRFPVGQNIFYARDVHDAQAAVHYWFKEGLQQIMDARWIKRFPYNNDHFGSESRILHFSQVIWADTKYIGCAWAKFGPDYIHSLIVCNYGPAGNINDASMYKMATDPSLIAEDCPEGRNPQYRSLCGCVQHTPEDPSWAQTFKFEPESEDLPESKKLGDKSPTLCSQLKRHLLVCLSLVCLVNTSKF